MELAFPFSPQRPTNPFFEAVPFGSRIYQDWVVPCSCFRGSGGGARGERGIEGISFAIDLTEGELSLPFYPPPPLPFARHLRYNLTRTPLHI